MKIIAIILMSLMCINSNGQIKTSGYIEIGWLSDQSSINETHYKTTGGSNDGFTDISNIKRFENIIRYDKNSFYADIVLLFKFKKIHLEQTLYSSFNYENGCSFKPLEIKYQTRLFYKMKSFKIGYEHMCLHPIINQHNELLKITRRASHDKIFIRYTFNAD